MENTIILGIITVIAIAAIWTLLKRSNRKGCCGSAGDYRASKKKLQHVIATKVFVIEGMHCEKCSNRVMEVVNDIPGVAADVNLKKGIANISYEYDVPDDHIKSRIERVGYTVKAIR